MGKYILTITILITLIVVFSGCSGGSSATTTPNEVAEFQAPDKSLNSNHALWGIWDLHFDPATLEIEIEPARDIATHYDITQIVLPPGCDGCIKIDVNSFDPETQVLDIDVTLMNQIGVPVYDVRGIIYTTEAGHMLLNPDDWIPLFDIPGGTDINPFKAFAKETYKRRFIELAEHTENFTIYLPPSYSFNTIKSAIEASWPVNCEEPYEIENFTQDPIYDVPDSAGLVKVGIKDWKGDVNLVRLSIPEITGQEFVEFSHYQNDIWEAAVTNTMDAAAGIYPAMITAYSANSGDIALHDFFDIYINHVPEPGGGWAQTWGGEDRDEALGIDVDVSGNIYITGAYQNIVDFDPGIGQDLHAAIHQSDVFLCKYGPEGNFLWARTWGGNFWDKGYAVGTTNDGYVYVTGSFERDTDFDPGPGVDIHPAFGCGAAFLSKFDSEGNFIWARTWQSGSKYDFIRGLALAADSFGCIYVTGGCHGWFDFAPGPETDIHWGFGPFLTKFDPSGEHLFAFTWGSGSQDIEGSGVAIGPAGYVFVTGTFIYDADLDPGPEVDEHTTIGISCFLSKFTPDGEYQWARTWGNSIEDRPNGLAIDDDCGIYITGFFQDSCDFNPGPDEDWHTSNGLRDSFLTKLDTDGHYYWARTWGSAQTAQSYTDEGKSVALGPDETVYTAGNFLGLVDFDPGPAAYELSSIGSDDIYLSKFDTDGIHYWTRTWDGALYLHTKHIIVSLDSAGNIYASGCFDSPADFDPGAGIDWHLDNGDRDIFLMKLLPNGYW